MTRISGGLVNVITLKKKKKNLETHQSINIHKNETWTTTDHGRSSRPWRDWWPTRTSAENKTRRWVRWPGFPPRTEPAAPATSRTTGTPPEPRTAYARLQRTSGCSHVGLCNYFSTSASSPPTPAVSRSSLPLQTSAGQRKMKLRFSTTWFELEGFNGFHIYIYNDGRIIFCNDRMLTRVYWWIWTRVVRVGISFHTSPADLRRRRLWLFQTPFGSFSFFKVWIKPIQGKWAWQSCSVLKKPFEIISRYFL